MIPGLIAEIKKNLFLAKVDKDHERRGFKI